MWVLKPAIADKQGCRQSRAKAAGWERRAVPFNPFLPGDWGVAAGDALQVLWGEGRGVWGCSAWNPSRVWEVGWENPSANEDSCPVSAA